MTNYDYEIVNGRKIRVRPKETVSEIDKNGYFRRQPNHFTTPFGDGENDLKAEGNKRYRLVWAKLCHWSNRAAIVRELEGLEDQIFVNMVEHAPHEKNLGWEYVYNENNKFLLQKQRRPFRRCEHFLRCDGPPGKTAGNQSFSLR